RPAPACVLVPPPRVSAHAATPGVYGAVRRNTWAWVAGFLVVFVPGLAWISMAPPMYRAELRLLVQGDGPQNLSSGRMVPATPAQVRSEIELLKSRELLNQVVRSGQFYGRSGGPQDAEVAKAVRGLEQGMEVEAVSGSSVIALRYAGPNPKE